MKNIFNIPSIVKFTLYYFLLGGLWLLTNNLIYVYFQESSLLYQNLTNVFFLFIFLLFFFIIIKKTTQTQLNLKVSESYLTAFFDNSTDLLILADSDLKVKGFNDTFAKYVKRHLRLDVEIGGDLIKYVIPDDEDLYFKRINQALNGNYVKFERHLKFENGIEYWFELSYRLIDFHNTGNKHFLITCRDITEAKSAQNEIEFGKLKFEGIFRNSFDALFIVDPATEKTIDCNQTALTFFDANSKEELIGTKGFDFHVIPWTLESTNELRKVLKNNPRQRIEIEYKTLKNRTFWGEFRATVVNIGNKSFRIVWITDISQRKQADEKLIQSENHLRAILDTTLETSVLLDKDIKVVFADKQLRESTKNLFNYEIKEGYSLLDYIENEEKTSFKKNFDHALEGHTIRKERKVDTKNGKSIWIDLLFSPIANKDGIIENVLFSFIDITSLKEVENKLRESEEKFKDMANSSPVMMWTADTQGAITFYNNEWLNFTGRTLEEELGHGWVKGAHPDDLKSFVYEIYYPSFKSQKAYQAEYRLKRYDKTYRWILEKGAPRYDSTGNFEGFYGSAIDITDRKMAELKTIEDEKFISKITELSPYIIYIYDIKQNIYVYLNNDSIGNLQMSKDKIIGSGQHIFYESIHPDDWDNFLYTKSYFKKLAEKGLVETDFRIITPDKKNIRWIQSRDTIFTKDTEGNPLQILGSARDITGKKLSDEKLLEEKKFSSRISESSPQIIFIYDVIINKVIYVNQRILDILGYNNGSITETPEDLISKTIHPDDIQKVQDTLINFSTLKDNEYIENEIRSRHYDGSYRWINQKLIVFKRDEQGNPIQMLGNATDITEKKEAEQKLIAQQKLTERITKLSPDIIYIQNLVTGLNTFQNRPIIEILGYPADYFKGNITEIFDDLLHPDDKISTWKNFLSIHNYIDSEINSYEFRLRNIDGVYRWFKVQELVFSRDESGKVIEILGTSRDITDEKKAIQDLLLAYQELKIANEELDGFVYRASHDLRSPLTSVLGLVNILKFELKEHPTHYNYLNLIQKSVEKLMNVIEDLINHSKNTRLDIASEPINFDQLVSETYEDLKYLEKVEKIQFNYKIYNKQDFYSDKLRLVLILQNLISNAIKYHVIHKENPYVNVVINFVNDKVIIEVSDNGSGIEEKYADKVFNMFYRASKDSTGSGLGLYIVKGIVEKLNGTIEMHTLYGHGSLFHLEIPNLARQTTK